MNYKNTTKIGLILAGLLSLTQVAAPVEESASSSSQARPPVQQYSGVIFRFGVLEPTPCRHTLVLPAHTTEVRCIMREKLPDLQVINQVERQLKAKLKKNQIYQLVRSFFYGLEVQTVSELSDLAKALITAHFPLDKHGFNKHIFMLDSMGTGEFRVDIPSATSLQSTKPILYLIRNPLDLDKKPESENWSRLMRKFETLFVDPACLNEVQKENLSSSLIYIDNGRLEVRYFKEKEQSNAIVAWDRQDFPTWDGITLGPTDRALIEEISRKCPIWNSLELPKFPRGSREHLMAQLGLALGLQDLKKIDVHRQNNRFDRVDSVMSRSLALGVCSEILMPDGFRTVRFFSEGKSCTFDMSLDSSKRSTRRIFAPITFKIQDRTPELTEFLNKISVERPLFDSEIQQRELVERLNKLLDETPPFDPEIQQRELAEFLREILAEAPEDS